MPAGITFGPFNLGQTCCNEKRVSANGTREAVARLDNRRIGRPLDVGAVFIQSIRENRTLFQSLCIRERCKERPRTLGSRNQLSGIHPSDTAT
jgi:hypothetical protein